MAKRKPFYLDTVDTDKFLQLPVSAQTLYFHLGMHTDNENVVVSPECVVERVRATMDDLQVLLDRGFAEYTEFGLRVILNDGGAVRG